MSRPPTVYGPDDAPPAGVLVSNTAQHVGILAAINIAFPILVLGVLDSSVDPQNYIGLALVVLGIGSLIQSRRTRWFGSGLMVPTTFTAAYLPGILLAAERGGIALVSGMLLFAAVVEIAIGLSIRRLRHVISVEIAGLVILVIGVLLGMVGFRLTFSLDPLGETIATRDGEPLLGIIVLGVMVLCAVYGPGRLKTLAALTGLLVGILISPLFGYMELSELAALAELPLVSVPVPETRVPAFAFDLAPAFLLAGLACALRVAGDVTTAQKTASPDWRRPEYRQISRGIVADGLTTLTSGVLGSLGPNSFSGSVGIAAAAGVMSRRVCVAIGIAMIGMGLLPSVRGFGLLVPPEVLGPVLIFSAAYIILNGMMVITSRALNNQRIMVVGIAMLMALASDRYLPFFEQLPALAKTLTQSDLTIAISVALFLKLILGVGRAAATNVTLAAGDVSAARAFVRAAAGELGVASEAAHRAETTLEEVFEAFPAEGGDERVLVRLSAATEAVTLTIKLPGALRLIGLHNARQSAVSGLDGIDNVEAFMSEVRHRLIHSRADRVAVKDRADHQVLMFVFDQ